VAVAQGISVLRDSPEEESGIGIDRLNDFD